MYETFHHTKITRYNYGNYYFAIIIISTKSSSYCTAKEVEGQMSKLSILAGSPDNDSFCPVLSKSQKKTLKKKEKKKAAPAPAFEIEEVITPTRKNTNTGAESQPIDTVSQPSQPVIENCGEAEKVCDLKHARTLRKKLKQIAELESRIASGDIKKPDQCQMDKIAMKSKYEQELADLS